MNRWTILLVVIAVAAFVATGCFGSGRSSMVVTVGFGWARTWGGDNFNMGTAVATDSAGNVYVTGMFSGTVDFDPGSGDNYISNDDYDIFLSKFDSSGNFEWVRTWGGSSNDFSFAVAVDGLGNVYVTGFYMDTVDFDPGGGDLHTNYGHGDAFLSKFDSLGNFKWARTWGGSADDRSQGIAADGSGNVYVTGYFSDTVDFDPGSGDNYISNDDYDVFLSKFDSSGNFEWAVTWSGIEYDCSYSVAIDGSGNVYVTGYFSGTVDFDPGSGDPHTSNGEEDAFLSKFDSSGNFEWARTWGGSLSDKSFPVATDGSGNVYVTGYYQDTVDFDPDGGDPHTSNGEKDTFLSKFDSLGNFKWARTWGGSSSDKSFAVTTDDPGNVYVSGHYQDTVDFDPGGGDPHTSNGMCDVFLSKFNSSGSFEWVHTWGGSTYDLGYGAAADSSGNIYVMGKFQGTVDFAPTDPPSNENPDEHTANGYSDIFLIKFLPDGCQ